MFCKKHEVLTKTNKNIKMMRKLFSVSVVVLLISSVFLPQQVDAQSPQKMSYQAIIRNSSEVLVADTEIGIQISILQNSETGSAVYVETQTATTNANGLVSLEIGAGVPTSGDFSLLTGQKGPILSKPRRILLEEQVTR